MTPLTSTLGVSHDAYHMHSAEGVTGGNLTLSVSPDPSAREVTVRIREDLADNGVAICWYAWSQLREYGWHDTAHVLRRDVLNEGYEPQPSAEYVIEWLSAHGIAVEWTPETERDEP